MLPGVADADAADTQTMSALWGICHPPGYPILMTCGALIAALPIGPGVAWRVNFLLVICGIIGALALYGAVRRMTGQILAGLVASTTLALSGVYWSHALYAEVYVFYGAILLLAVYFAVRFVQSDRVVWLNLTALALGVCVFNRPAELFVLPAFFGLWLIFRGQAHVTIRRVAIAMGLAITPFAYTLLFFFARENPAYLHARDDAVRDAILREGEPFPALGFAAKLHEAFVYCTGLKWAGAKMRPTFGWDLDKYAWRLSGFGGVVERFDRDDPAQRNKADAQGRGSDITLAGLLLAIVGVVFARGRAGWVFLGLGMFAGNTVFYLYHHPPDNLDFTLPGQAGLALLIGLAAAGPGRPRMKPSPHSWRLLCLLIPAYLLVTNYAKLDRSTPEEHARLQNLDALASAPLPRGCAIIARYPRAMMYRYLFHVQASRGDVQVIINRYRYTQSQMSRLAHAYSSRGSAVFVSLEDYPPRVRAALIANTDPDIARVGLARLRPGP